MIDLTSFSNDPAATPILAMIREGRWRKARDAAKDLCKRDRARYLPLLITANVGLANELQGRGLDKDASTVIAYLKTIAPAELWQPMLAKLAESTPKAASKQVARSGAGKSAGADGWAAALRVDEISIAGGNPAPEDIAAVDLLVPDAFVPVMIDAASERASIVEKELTSVRKACDATGTGQWDAAREFLRELPRQSIFRHWRMFLRGVACFFNNDFATARQCFGTLPPQGALAMAAHAIDPTLAPAGDTAPGGVLVPFYLAATGQPGAWASSILTANAEVKAGKFFKSFRTLEAGIKGKFPSEKAELSGELTRGLIPYVVKMNQLNEQEGTAILEYCVDRYGNSSKVSQGLLSVIFRPYCLATAGKQSATILDSTWRGCIAFLNTSEGPNPERDSIAFEWLGNSLCDKNVLDDSFDFLCDPPTSLPLARSAYEKAVKLFPSNESAWISLIDLLVRLRDFASRDAILDELVVSFPSSKRILQIHGSVAIAQGNDEKAITSLRAALALDPLDPTIRKEIVRTFILQKIPATSKDPVANISWETIEPFLDPRPYPSEWFLSRWLMRSLRAALEPEVKTAKTLQDEAATLAPSPIEHLFVELLFGMLSTKRRRRTWSTEWKKALATQEITWNLFTKLIELHCFASNLPAWSSAASLKITPFLKSILDTLLVQKILNAADDILVFLDQYERLLELQNSSTAKSFFLWMKKIKYTFEILAPPLKRKADPRLRIATIFLREYHRYYNSWDFDRFINDIQTIKEDALKLGMNHVISHIEAICARFSLGPPKWKQEVDFYHDDDDDDDDDDDYDYDDDEPIIPAPSRKKIQPAPTPTPLPPPPLTPKPAPVADKKPQVSKKSAVLPVNQIEQSELF